MKIEEMIANNKQDCCGCYACYNACPVSCIQMCSDNEGFWYPQIDINKCIKSGNCDKSCPVLIENVVVTDYKREAYAFINKNEDIRKASSSGGMFSELANYVLNNDGIVFGAGFNDKWEVVHQKINFIDDLYKLRGSKYVQSRIGTVYKKVKQYLVKGDWVLFSGTPCQVEGLKSYLQKEYNNLITVDLICHGVPSPLVWQKYAKLRNIGKKFPGFFFEIKTFHGKGIYLKFLLKIQVNT